jgi:hypothetical protein
LKSGHLSIGWSGKNLSPAQITILTI